MEIEQEHPIPQQISTYTFRLVGDMTLKQFFQVAAGVVLALLVYASSLPPIVKWPVIAIFVLLGIAFAFFTIEERPLETWVVIFFRAIYTPTEFIWKKTEKEPVYFQEPLKAKPVLSTNQVQLSTATPDQSQKVSVFPNLERSERSILQNIGKLFTTPHIPAIQAQPVPQTNPVTPAVTVPATSPTQVEKQKVPETDYQTPISTVTTEVKQTLTGTGRIEGIEAEFSPDAAPPSPPTLPNTIVGQVIDANRKIVEGAILEIKDSEGRPARALKSNKAGHFMVVIPLTNGNYEIITKKEGFEFEPIKLLVEGKIIPPIAIRAKDTTKNIQQTK